MTETLKELIGRLATLPAEEQDRYAEIYLAELESDQRWDELFAQTTDEQWRKLAAEAEAEIERGETRPLDALHAAE